MDSLHNEGYVFVVAVGACMYSVYKNVVKIIMGILITKIRPERWSNTVISFLYSDIYCGIEDLSLKWAFKII